MLDIFVANSLEQIDREKLPVRMSLGGATYWLLHRYFVHTDLNPGGFDFMNMYEDTEINGYQLHRLKTELKEALRDLSARPSTFPVLTGWLGTEKTRGAEDWREVDREKAARVIESLLSLIDEAIKDGSRLFAIGD
jgi:hypothetical protein